jgi:putative ABC transport system substrate-binding protein
VALWLVFAAFTTCLAQPPVKRIGYLSSATKEAVARNLNAFREAMRELGYSEGRQFVIVDRYANGDHERLVPLAKELVESNVDVMLTGGTPATLAAQQATRTVPIVTPVVGNPIGTGLAASLARPGGNVTGLTNLDSDLGGKRLQLLATIGRMTRVAFLVNPDNPNYRPTLAQAQSMGRTLGVEVITVYARTPDEIERVLVNAKRDRIDGVLVIVDPFINQQAQQIAKLAMALRLPTVGGLRDYAVAGGLVSYGEDLAEMYRRSAAYVDRIFKGARPGDIPFDQSTKLELVLNARTAKAIGVHFPESLSAIADSVIE